MLRNILSISQVLLWIPSQSCIHMGTSAKRKKWHACAQGNIRKTLETLQKTNQAMHNVPRGLYLSYYFRLGLSSLLASRTSLGATAILAKF